MPSLFITGTDTGVGKTTFTCWLVRMWLALGYRAAGLKPIASGDRVDAIALRHVMENRLELNEINPVHFRDAVSPLAAARAENRTIDFAALNHGIWSACAHYSHLAVEGVGGWRVPLAPNYDVRNWARDLGFPVVVVARGTLGTLNHTQLTVDSIRESGLICAGVVVNAGPRESRSPDFDFALRENVGLLRELLRLPVFEFDSGLETTRHIPIWLGGKEV